jgi:hypothetical protein
MRAECRIQNEASMIVILHSPLRTHHFFFYPPAPVNFSRNYTGRDKPCPYGSHEPCVVVAAGFAGGAAGPAPSASEKSWLRFVMKSAPLAGTGVL